MAATRAKATQSRNGDAPDKAKLPLITAGAAAAGLAGGLALGSRIASKPRGLAKLMAPQRKVLGLPVGRQSGALTAAKALGKVARELGTATHKVSATGDEVRQVREQLDKVNRQSPVEVLLDGLTHRRGAHKHES